MLAYLDRTAKGSNGWDDLSLGHVFTASSNNACLSCGLDYILRST